MARTPPPTTNPAADQPGRNSARRGAKNEECRRECRPPICRHCKRNRANRPRGLCWTCYYAPGVKDLYPSTSKFAHRTPPEHETADAAQPPDQPTDAPAGSLEKMRAMARRVARRQELHHADDARELHHGPRPFEGHRNTYHTGNPTGLE